MKNKYTRKVFLFLGMGLLGGFAANAQQKIGANPGNLNPGAVLELESSNRGFLLPRVALPTTLTTFGLNGTATPASNGMLVFNTNASTPGGVGYYVWSGTTGTEAAPVGGAWSRIFTGTALGASNGLSVVSGNVELGGTLSKATTIGHSSDLEVRFGSSGSLNQLTVIGSTPVFSLGRTGITGAKRNAMANFGLGTYEASASAKTQLDIRLSEGNVDAPDVTVMSLRGNGNVGIGTTSPSEKLHVSGGALISSLGGAGTQMVITDNNGTLSKQAIPVNTDAQTLTLTGSTLAISGGNSVTLPTASVTGAANGLTLTSGNVTLGGTLTGATTITGITDVNTLTFSAPASTVSSLTNFSNPLAGGRAITTFSSGSSSSLSDLQIRTAGTTYSETIFGMNIGGKSVIMSATSDILLGTQAAKDLIFATNNAERMRVLSSGNVGIGTTTPTSTLQVNGSVAKGIRRITAARTLDASDYTIIANAFSAAFTITLPAPSTCSGREYVIRKIDESSNALTFTFTGITGTKAIRVSDSSATVGEYMNSLNYNRTIRIQSDGTDWYLID